MRNAMYTSTKHAKMAMAVPRGDSNIWRVTWLVCMGLNQGPSLLPTPLPLLVVLGPSPMSMPTACLVTPALYPLCGNHVIPPIHAHLCRGGGGLLWCHHTTTTCPQIKYAQQSALLLGHPGAQHLGVHSPTVDGDIYKLMFHKRLLFWLTAHI